jgi:Chemotaxis phosphatase CheX
LQQLTTWLAAAADSAREIAITALGVSDAVWQESSAPIPVDLSGVYIPLLSQEIAVQFGMLAEHPVCVKLAKGLMGMQDDEPLEADEEIFDAMGEVANLIVGGIKMRLAGEADISLGLPLALTGQVFPSAHSSSVHGLLRLDDRQVWLVVIGTKA